MTPSDFPAGLISHKFPNTRHLNHGHSAYNHRGPISALNSLAHGYRFGGSGAGARGVYTSHSGTVYHPSGSSHMGIPSGGHASPEGYDYHPVTGPHAPIADVPRQTHISWKSENVGSSSVAALTLLSFLFFLNILQGCLKEHMDTMNPTVMVMTGSRLRSRATKLAEMNSREQQTTVSEHLPQSVIMIHQSESTSETIANVMKKQNPFDQNVKAEDRPDPEPEYYTSYTNRTLVLPENNYKEHYYDSFNGNHDSASSAFSSRHSVPGSPLYTSYDARPANSNYGTLDPIYMRIY